MRDIFFGKGWELDLGFNFYTVGDPGDEGGVILFVLMGGPVSLVTNTPVVG